jgi:hypothetical protein
MARHSADSRHDESHGTYSHLAASLAWIAAMEQSGWHGWPVLAPQHGHGAGYPTRTSSSTAWLIVVPVLVVLLCWRLLEVLRRLGVSDLTRLSMVGNCTSAWCMSRLARGNSNGRTHSETSSNYLCTNDG